MCLWLLPGLGILSQIRLSFTVSTQGLLHCLLVFRIVMFDCCLFKACLILKGNRRRVIWGNNGDGGELGEVDRGQNALNMYCIREENVRIYVQLKIDNLGNEALKISITYLDRLYFHINNVTSIRKQISIVILCHLHIETIWSFLMNEIYVLFIQDNALKVLVCYPCN